MIAEILAIAGIGGVTYASLDHENLLPWSATVDGSKKWFWEKSPFVTAHALPRPSPIQIQPRLSPQQELAEARRSVIYSEQLLASVSRKYPALAVKSKYALTQPSQPQQFIEPYKPKTYP